ncbi:MAG: SDR family NAD(P)-dependent oxidoreductase, partial [Gemmatimonadota bacterium]|nr:SDR family NAD(P)-dependent oxidoreductase [Gemmatimonadota bacterium]
MSENLSATERFDLGGRVFVITGGGGLLGAKHAEAIASARGVAVVVDINHQAAERVAADVGTRYASHAMAVQCDITKPAEVEKLLATVLERFGRVDGLINNAANNPKVEDTNSRSFSRLEDFPLEQWEDDVAVGLTGAFL